MRRRDRLQRLVLVPVSPLRHLPWQLLAGLVLVLVAAIAFWGGRQSVLQPSQPASTLMKAVRGAAERRVQAAEEHAAVKLKECDIIDAASRQLQEDNQELLASLASLEGRVAFFKRMAAPQAAAQRADIEQFDLLPGHAGGQIRYRLLISRGSDAGAPGQVRLRISGQGRQQVITPDAPRFQFRYYQQYSGEFALAPGLQPERVDIELRAGGTQIARRYKWEIRKS